MKTIRPEEWQLLEMFTWKIRVAVPEQLDVFGQTTRGALHRLLDAKLLSDEEMLIRILVLDRPLVTWAPGDPAPDFSSLSWLLENRRHKAEPVISRVTWASEKALQLTGGCGGRIRQPFQVEHDVGTAGAFLRRCVLFPETWEQWLGEDILRLSANRRQSIPDAVLCCPEGRVRMAIEYGGAYSPARLRRFHHHCLRASIPYEVW